MCPTTCGITYLGLTCTRRPHAPSSPHHDGMASASWPLMAPVDEPVVPRKATLVMGAVVADSDADLAPKGWLSRLTTKKLPEAPTGKTLVAHRTR